MPGMSNQYRSKMLDDWFGDTRAEPKATRNGTFADVFASFAEAPPGPNCDQHLAVETRRIYVPMVGPVTDPSSGLLQMVSSALVSLSGWRTPTQDEEQVLTQYILWDGPETDETSIPIGRGPLGGFPYEACSVDNTNDDTTGGLFTSMNHGYMDGNNVEIFAVPLQNPTMPGFNVRPDTKYVAVNCTGPNFQIADPSAPTVPLAVGVAGSCLVVRAKRHTIDEGGLLEIPAGELALPMI